MRRHLLETEMIAAPRPRHYRVIYADPPWTFATYSRKGKGRSAEAYYNCMSLAEIRALPVAEWLQMTASCCCG
jgi:hypothetical protein